MLEPSTVERPGEALACLAFHLSLGGPGSAVQVGIYTDSGLASPSHLVFFPPETGVLDTL